MTDEMSPIRVLAIVGYGRSGSTLLDMVLGQHDRIMGAGELTTLSRHVWPNDEYCSCGQTARNCDVWGPIGRNWMRETGRTPTADGYVALQNKIEMIVSPMRTLGRTLTRQGFQSYAQATVELLSTVRSRSGKAVIVDSSKLPGRALALACIPSIDLTVVHLVRDGRGVAWSMLRSYPVDAKAGLQKQIVPKSTTRTAIRWGLVNLAAEMLRWKLGRERYLRVRYEDFVSDPEATLHRIGRMLDVDMSEIASAVGSGRPIASAHQIAGSRLRMGGPVRLQHDEAWRRDMPDHEQAKFNRISGWLLRRYGYRTER